MLQAQNQFAFLLDSQTKQTQAKQTAGSGQPSKTSCTVSLAPACSPRDSGVTDGGMDKLWMGVGRVSMNQ